ACRRTRRYPLASAPWHRDTDQFARLFPPASGRSTNACTDDSPARTAKCFKRLHAPSAQRSSPVVLTVLSGCQRPAERVLVLGRGEELGHERGDLCWPLEQEEVSCIVDDPQARVRDEPGQDVSVDGGYDRVVVAGEHERGLRQPPEPR